MRLSELKDKVYQSQREEFDTPLTHRDTSTLVDIFIKEISAGLLSSNKVYLAGLGCLERVTRKGRTWSIRGTSVSKGERDTIVFKPFMDIKNKINPVRT